MGTIKKTIIDSELNPLGKRICTKDSSLITQPCFSFQVALFGLFEIESYDVGEMRESNSQLVNDVFSIFKMIKGLH